MIEKMSMADNFHQRAITIIKKIPRGKVATYGQIATMAGNPIGARQVVRILHSSSEKENLPWHRIVNGKATISLPKGSGYELQKAILQKEGIIFDKDDAIDFELYLWKPGH
ncbi:MAG: MGMT family protein [candidate division Zixibacteria bacterium]|nr:MGMT family protein [candidate division Zixibacteria bacterium]